MIEFIDSDSNVKSFMKINENYHDFASVMHVRDDGMLSNYHPDFIVRIDGKIYLVETKAERDLKDVNVRQKDWLLWIGLTR